MVVNVNLRGEGDMKMSVYDSNKDGVIEVTQIGNLPATKITSLVFDLARVPTMDLAHLPALSQIAHNAKSTTTTLNALTWFDLAYVTLTTLAVDVAIIASFKHQQANVNTYNVFRINIDNSSYSQEYSDVTTATGRADIGAIVHKAALSAGSHTIKLQGKPQTVNGTVYQNDILVIELKK